MAIKATNQITITDVTDAYSVFMDNDSYTYMASTSDYISGSCLTNIRALNGSNDVTVAVTSADITFYSQGSSSPMANPPFTKSVTSSNSGKLATVTFTAVQSAQLTTPIDAVIPIKVDDNTITVSKRFTLSATPEGQQGTQGPQGPTGPAGDDAITLSVLASNGTVFKNNNGSTVLSAHVYLGGVEKTVTAGTGVVDGGLGTVKWYKGLNTDTQPSGWPKAAGTLTVTAGDITNAQAYTCTIEQ